MAGYIYADAGEGESSTDLVFSAQNMIAENGILLGEAERFKNQMVCSELDIDRLVSERRADDHLSGPETGGICDRSLQSGDRRDRTDPQFFFPSLCSRGSGGQGQKVRRDPEHAGHGTEETAGAHLLPECGHRISGGLDSTLALLVTARAFDMLDLPREQITAVTMPCFGTTDRTYQNACQLTRCLGASLKEVDIKEAVNLHFRDIGQSPETHDVTYENSQARERTQILMDLANQTGGLVVGTGDLSELALGWATYNGDHMSMYAVNCSVPKTLVRHLVRYYADTCGDAKLSAILLDVLDTPVSPELLPPEDGKISQKTEELVGPYELHDFSCTICCEPDLNP